MKRWQILLTSALVITVLVFIAIWVIPAYIYHPEGYCTGSRVQVRDCLGYNFWSGIAGSFVTSVLTGSGLWTATFLWWWHHRCDTPGCLRKGKHPTADQMHKLCRVCHPDHPGHKLSLAEITELHHEAKRLNRTPRRHDAA
jgi:hypothetical protein